MKITTLLLLIWLAPNLATGQTFSAMTYNLRYATDRDGENAWSKRRADVANLLNYYAPDFLGTQEGLKHQLDYLDERLPNHAYIGVGREDGAEKGEYTAIFYDSSRFELLQTSTFWLSEKPDEVSVGWDAALPRTCTFASFRNHRTLDTIHVYNAHFDHLGEVAREQSAALIMEKIESWSPPRRKVILLGDFNSEPDTKPIDHFTDKLEDGWLGGQYGKPPGGNVYIYGPEGTFNGFDVSQPAKRRIDYVFFRQLYLLRFRHIDDRRPNNLSPSDHLPVFAVFAVE